MSHNNTRTENNDDNNIKTGRHYTVKPSPHLHTASGNLASRTENDDNDSPILLEARLSETVLSLRQLIHTNRQLDEALLNDSDDDVDLFEALKENDDLIARKRNEVTAMSQTLKELGVQVNSWEEDMPVYGGSVVLKKLEEERRTREEECQSMEKEENNGLYL